MTAIIAYGSLINKDQFCNRADLCQEAHPVMVQGYQRIFNQEPSWRKGQGQVQGCFECYGI